MRGWDITGGFPSKNSVWDFRQKHLWEACSQNLDVKIHVGRQPEFCPRGRFIGTLCVDGWTTEEIHTRRMKEIYQWAKRSLRWATTYA